MEFTRNLFNSPIPQWDWDLGDSIFALASDDFKTNVVPSYTQEFKDMVQCDARKYDADAWDEVIVAEAVGEMLDMSEGEYEHIDTLPEHPHADGVPSETQVRCSFWGRILQLPVLLGFTMLGVTSSVRWQSSWSGCYSFPVLLGFTSLLVVKPSSIVVH
jgi:hypothetical protein